MINNSISNKEQLLKDLKVLRAQLAVLEEAREGRKKAEDEADLLKTLILAISSSSNLDSALEVALRKVCETTGWVLGQAWLPSKDGKYLECSKAWYCSREGLEKFRILSEGFKFPPGIGLPGRVWKSRCPSWARDVTQDTNFPRAPIAFQVGLKAGFAVPILAKNNEVIAVIEFFMLEPREEDVGLVSLVSAVATQLGAVFERKQTEEELKELVERRLKGSEEKYRKLIESANDAIFIADIESGVIVDANKQAEKLLGLPRKKIIGMHQTELHPKEETERYSKLFREHVQKGASISEELFVCNKNGQKIPVEISASVIEIGGKKVIQGIFRDLSSWKQSEEIHTQLVSLVESSNDAIFSWTLDGYNICWNKSAERIYGYFASEIKNKHVSILVPIDRHQEVEEIFGRIKKGERIENYETIRLRKDGKPIHVSLTISPIKDSNGNVTGLSTIARDITELKKLQMELEKAKQEEEQRKELQTIDRLVDTPQIDTITKLFGFTPLRESFPAVFEEMIIRYENLLELAIEKHGLNEEGNLSDELHFMGKQLGFLRAGPTDVLEIHSATLKRKNNKPLKAKTQIYNEICRRTAIELISYLTTYYRNFTMSMKKINVLDDRDTISGIHQ